MLDLAKDRLPDRSFHHGVEAYKIADRLAQEGIAARCGPTGGASSWKPTTASGRTRARRRAAGGRAIVHSDSDEGIQRLNQEAAKAMRAGSARASTSRRARDPLDDLEPRDGRWASRTASARSSRARSPTSWSGTANPFSVYALADRSTSTAHWRSTGTSSRHAPFRFPAGPAGSRTMNRRHSLRSSPCLIVAAWCGRRRLRLRRTSSSAAPACTR